MPKHIQNINRMPRGGVMFEKLLQYFYFAEKTADWILNCHDDGDKQTQKFLGCVLPQGNRILFLSCGSNFFVSPKKKSLTSATPSVLVLPTPVWPCPRLCQRGEPKTRIRQLVQLSWSPGGSQHGPLGRHAHVLLQHLRWVCLLLIALDISWHGCVCQLASKFLAFSFNISSSRLFIHGPWMRCTLMADIAFTLLVVLSPLPLASMLNRMIWIPNNSRTNFCLLPIAWKKLLDSNTIMLLKTEKPGHGNVRSGMGYMLWSGHHMTCVEKMDFFSTFFIICNLNNNLETHKQRL